MLKSAEDQRVQLERDRDAELQRVMRVEKEEHVEELRALKDEHARLLAQVEDDERRQRENVHSLTQQMSEYKQTTIDAEGQVRALTQRTADLERTNEDLFYQLKQLREDYEDQLQAVREKWDTERQQLLKSIRDLEQRSAVPVANSNSSESVSDPEVDLLVSGAVASASEEIWEWLNGRVDQLAAANIAR
jgi:chromosome segregation ATPase